MTVRGRAEVFRGADAVAAGLVTRDRLRGPGYVRLLPDTYARVRDREPDLGLRSRAASVWAGPGSVLCGYSAAELLGRSCAPPSAPAEVVVPGRAAPRTRADAVVRRETLRPAEVTEVDGVRVTTPLRTAFDLARRVPGSEGVVAVDALARAPSTRTCC
ncbi:type IV toxin-antitoxin system AbiEi family antitoxin [Pseudonocardia sp. HH130630-07]|uniref:type IV toxin-antitoxin system AbiEi family antitoxin n=1 Tax=Pseudonocardia sp. HH130630-07 TaxID=1690815 RepID=UPI000814FFF4|nr:type IV toxin-antitoxin system AbiEi family antitoxin [Pseudonocardia sp. HH130630-07]ANY07396.1 hypothetical protein AFB00_15090 [Pseudonocardia sp. HH130630-07]